MKSRTTCLICLALLVLAFTSQAQLSRAATPPEIGLGFGPSDVQPISSGIPIYTQGDNLWVESYYNTTIDVELQSPSGMAATPITVVEPGQLFDLYQFGANASSGVWLLAITTEAGLSNLPISLVPPDSSLVPVFAGDLLSGNRVNQTFDLPATNAYNIEVCTVGESLQHEVGFGLLGGLNGTIEVTMADLTSTFTVFGIPSPVSLWIELYSQYSYGLTGGSTASQSLLVASTQVSSFSPPGGNVSVALNPLLPLRAGRFDMRVFVRTSAGLTLHDFQFLRTTAGSWASLGGCTSTASVSSSVISLSTNLDSANASWPRQLLTMYSFGGQESYTWTSVPGTEAAIHLRDYPDGKELTGVSITAASPGLLPADWDSYNSSVYLLTNGKNSTFLLDLSFSGVITESLNVTLGGTYASKTVLVPAGTLVASTASQGNPLRNATITVASPGSAPTLVEQSPPGSVSLLLPPDNYTVSAAYSGISATRALTVTAGHISTVSIDLTQQSPPIFTYALVAAGAAGVVANVLIWRQYLERRKVYG